VVAREWGLFAQHGLNVELAREVGWATVRDKLIHGDLEAAHALAGMPFAAALGVGSIVCPSLTGLILNRQGNAIAIARPLVDKGGLEAATFGEQFRRKTPSEPLVFGVVSLVSSHRYLMERWLNQAGLRPELDYRLAVVPPPQMPDLIRGGHLAGFCVGEPWCSVAVEKRLGCCVATSAEIAPGHPEKVLMVTAQFAREHSDEHLRLVAAVLRACEICAQPERHADIARCLSERRYINAPAALIQRSFGPGFTGATEPFTIYHGSGVNRPSAALGRWVLENLVSHQATEPASALVTHVFREDLHEAALKLCEFTHHEDEPVHETESASV
jgi:ABC-type nitrate/sulfonate/bicarbonate transport system substrate-binding protein